MTMYKRASACLVICILVIETGVTAARKRAQQDCSVVVYGSTPAGLCAGIAASRRLRSSATASPVCLVSPHKHVGGMVTGGLGATDTGGSTGEALIGGIALEFFKEVGSIYGQTGPVYHFEPSVASKAFQNLLDEAQLKVETGELQHVNTVKSPSGYLSIQSIDVGGDMTFLGEVFIDATYEGDLMAAAGVDYTYGRESSSQYNETINGRQRYTSNHQFTAAVDPINHTTGEVLQLVSRVDPGQPGDADQKVTSYNLRLCLTKNETNRVAIQQPPNYDPSRWELLRRYVNSSQVASGPSLTKLFIISSLPHGKTDVNNFGPVSSDFIGGSWLYPESEGSQREQIVRNHYQYTHELLWTIGHDPAISPTIRNEMLEYGLCADEFLENEWYEPHWPPQLYVREARRMVGPYVFTQHSAEGPNSTERGNSSIGCGSYNFDAHNSQRYPCHPNSIQCHLSTNAENPCCKSSLSRNSQENQFNVINEGNIQVNPGRFEIPYDVLLPSDHEASNLLVPGAVSSSHIGFSCLRLEPQWMIMGHSSGTAAALAVRNKSPVKAIDRNTLHELLLQEGQILHTTKK